MIRAYTMLTKPGILLGNLITMAGGFALASQGNFNPWLFLQTAIGLGLIIASACIFNNYMDREFDAKMARTKQRAFVQRTVSVSLAISIAVLMGLAGAAALWFYTNPMATLLAIAGFLFYVGMYTVFKHRSTSGTLIGSIAGAMPPVVGYCAVNPQIDEGSILLFLALFLWQMPHFYAIAIYRFKEYAAAGTPVLPVRRGTFIAKVFITAYVILFSAVVPLFTIFRLTGGGFLLIMVPLNAIWVVYAFLGFKTQDNVRWAHNLFRYSLIVILTFSVLLGLRF